MSKSVEELTEEARRSVAAARRAAGEPWQDDSDKDIFWLAAEAEAICDRVLAKRHAPKPKRRWWPW